MSAHGEDLSQFSTEKIESRLQEINRNVRPGDQLSEYKQIIASALQAELDRRRKDEGV